VGNVSEQDFRALVEVFDNSDWLQLRVEFSGLTIELSKRSAASTTRVAPTRTLRGRPQHGSKPAAQRQTSGSSMAQQLRVPKGWVVVRAPNLGTFRRATNGAARPCVDVGESVKPDTDVCLIQVMKLFTSVPAGAQGVVRQICALDGELVEYDQPLLVIEPQRKDA
jgi:acetyl-CoA carboxylase biotin carboxyl carrier protein